MVKIARELHAARQKRDFTRHQPHYPKELFNWLLSRVQYRETAWDCGTGKGQTAGTLSDFFETVIATDISEQQISGAFHRRNIDYRIMPAEITDIEDHSVDLITVSQALHHFHPEEFAKEAQRVLKPTGILACWNYGRMEIDPKTDILIQSTLAAMAEKLREDPEGLYPDEEERELENFPHMESSTFVMIKEWHRSDIMGYLRQMVLVQRYCEQNGEDKLENLEHSLAKNETEKHFIYLAKWKIWIKAGKVCTLA